MSSELRRVRATFADDNPLLHLTLGMLSTFKAFDTLLATYASTASLAKTSTSDAEQRPPNVAVDDAAVDFTLGLLAFREQLIGSIAKASFQVMSDSEPDANADDDDQPATPSSPTSSSTRSLWR